MEEMRNINRNLEKRVYFIKEIMGQLNIKKCCFLVVVSFNFQNNQKDIFI